MFSVELGKMADALIAYAETRRTEGHGKVFPRLDKIRNDCDILSCNECKIDQQVKDVIASAIVMLKGTT